MYPYIFPSHWIKRTWHNLLHSSIFCEIDEKWNWGHLVALNGWEKGYVERDFLVGEETPRAPY